MSKSRIAYHSQRASAELHQGLVTSCPAAARAHLKLSALHFEKVRTLKLNTFAKPGAGRTAPSHLESEAKPLN